MAMRYVAFDHEVDNFTYEIANAGELSMFLAQAFGVDARDVAKHIQTLATDGEVAQALRLRLATRRDRNSTMPFGRRLGWFAIARVCKPQIIVETGVHDGWAPRRCFERSSLMSAKGFLDD